MVMLTNLADVCRKSGLIVVEIPGWQTRGRPGSFNPIGWCVHHTGSYDDIGDTSSDRAYADWLARVGRSDLPAPLCQVALSAESVVYVCAAGRANHAGVSGGSGPIPAGDGNALMGGTEAYNSGSQGWRTVGNDAAGNPVTQYEGYVRLQAALAEGYGWSADHTRAHRETSTTGKWDPGLLDMEQFRRDIANQMEDEMSPAQEKKLDKALDELGELRVVVGRMRGGSWKRDQAIAKQIKALRKSAVTDADLKRLERLLSTPDEEVS